MSKRQTTNITIEHVVVTSNKSYEDVIASLEDRMGSVDMGDLLGHLEATNASWKLVTVSSSVDALAQAQRIVRRITLTEILHPQGPVPQPWGRLELSA